MAAFFSPRYPIDGRPPEPVQAARPSPWCLNPGGPSRPLEPWFVARVSRPLARALVTFNQVAVPQLTHAINLLIRLNSGFAGLLPGARNSGRAPRCSTRCSTRWLPGARPGRRAGAWCLVRGPPSWSDQAAELVPGARTGTPFRPAKTEGHGPGAKKQAGSRAAQALARFHTLNAARNRIGSPFPASLDPVCFVPETHPLDL